MSAVGWKCDRGEHSACNERLGAVLLLNGMQAVLVCECACHLESGGSGR